MPAHDLAQSGEIRRAAGCSVEDGGDFAEVVGAQDSGCHDRERLCIDVDCVVELVDSAAKIQSLLPFLDEAVQEGLITIEAVRVLRYRHNRAEARP